MAVFDLVYGWMSDYVLRTISTYRAGGLLCSARLQQIEKDVWLRVDITDLSIRLSLNCHRS